MTQKTIGGLPLLDPPMNGAEWVEVEREVDGTPESHKVPSGALAQAPPAARSVTTGAATVDLDPLGLFYVVTTGGTAGDETLNVRYPTVDDNITNAAFIGRPLVIYVPALTDPADRVLVTVEGRGQIQCYNYQPIDGIGAIHNVALDYDGALIALTWTGEDWVVNFHLMGSSEFFHYQSASPGLVALQGGDAANGVTAGPITLTGGAGDTDNPDAGPATVAGGNSFGTGAGGDGVLKGGNSTGGTPGAVVLRLGEDGNGGFGFAKIIGLLPAADPQQVGCLFTVGAVGPGVPRQIWISGGTI